MAEDAADGDTDEMRVVYGNSQAKRSDGTMPGIIKEIAVCRRANKLDELDNVKANGVLPLSVRARGKAATQWAQMKGL